MSAITCTTCTRDEFREALWHLTSHGRKDLLAPDMLAIIEAYEAGTLVQAEAVAATPDYATMTLTEARQLGVQRYRDGYTFAENNVRPAGFTLGAIKAGRLDMIDALDEGWHAANMAEPVVIDGRIIGSTDAQERLEWICDSCPGGRGGAQ